MKASEVKKTLGFFYKHELKSISARHSWASIKSDEKRRELVLTALSDDPSIQALRDFVGRINKAIIKNWPDCDIQMRLVEFSIRFSGEVTQ